MIKDLKDKKTKIHKDTFIADSADVMGDITIEKGASLWYGVVARGDMNIIKIGENTNIQDNATIHVDDNEPCIIGDNVTVGHNAIVHGCTVGDNTLIGMGSIILDRAEIGENSIIGAGALVTEDKVIPPRSLVMGVPGKVVRQLTDEEIEMTKRNADRYVELWKNEHI